MTSKEIQQQVEKIFIDFDPGEFIFDLLLAYGISKTSITRLKKGDFNLSKEEDEVLYKKKVFFKQVKDKLLLVLENVCQEERILTHKPRFAIITDSTTLVARDLKLGRNLDISLADLPKHYDFFLPLAGSEVYNSSNDNEADRNAAYKMAELYDALRAENPHLYNSKESIHELNVFLSRILFCYFAEDTEIFDVESVFTDTLAQHTGEDGRDTDHFLSDLFRRLNTKTGTDYPAFLARFPYVNGGLFRNEIVIPRFTAKARRILIELGELNWRDINPDIFGSMIQAVVIPEYRSDLGMHYTSVPNILKLIRPLFLDELYDEFEKSQDSIKKLRSLINRLSRIKFFDPACGSGNFLIITYKELRMLEINILQRIIDLSPIPEIQWSAINLSQFYGIEIDDFAHEMAILSLWLAEHQMNKIFDEMLAGLGQSKPILPLKDAGQIHQGNATRIHWNDVCPVGKNYEVFVIGNPPYLGYSRQDEEQKTDMTITFAGVSNYKKLDYICCWFYKATYYIENAQAKYAFVTTNSITQGEQVALLWPLILNKNQEISFAHLSFKWTNNAKGNAGVSVVIIGIRNQEEGPKYLFDENHRQEVKNINPYLSNASNLYVTPRSKPLSRLPKMIKGSSPGDNGNLLLDEQEMETLLKDFPESLPFIKKYIGAQEFIKGSYRYCIHVSESRSDIAYKIEGLSSRFEKVRKFRLASKKKATQKKSLVPHLFDEDKYRDQEFILVPQTGSERRDYIPIGYFDSSYLPSNAVRVLYDSSPWLFGVIASRMHITWVKAVAGRLKMDMQYSNTLCYNTFPFPDISLKQKENLNLYVFSILDERAKHPEKTMAQLYDPDTMPQGLKKAHQELDQAIEQCYRLQPFRSDTERLEYLFKLYEEMITNETLFARQKNTRKRKS